MTWAAILVLGAGAYAFKVLGIVVLGPRVVARYSQMLGVIALLPAAVLTALIAVQTFDLDRSLVLDARAAGLAAAAIAAWRKAPFLVVVLAGAVVTALLRQLS